MLLDGLMVAALLDLDISLFVQLAIFLTTVVGLNFLVFKPLFKVMDLRHERTAGLHEKAVTREGEGEAAQESHERLYAEIVDEGDSERKASRDAAQANEQRVLDEAKTEAAALRKQEEAAIEGERKAAHAAMEKEIGALGGAIADRVTR